MDITKLLIRLIINPVRLAICWIILYVGRILELIGFKKIAEERFYALAWDISETIEKDLK